MRNVTRPPVAPHMLIGIALAFAGLGSTSLAADPDVEILEPLSNSTVTMKNNMGVVIVYARFNNGTTAGSAKVMAVTGGMTTLLGMNTGMQVNHPTYGVVYKFSVGIPYADYSNVKIEVVGAKMGMGVDDEVTGLTIDAQ